MSTAPPTQPDSETPGPARPTGRLHWGPPWLTPATSRSQIDTLYLLVAGLMVFVGLLFFGWHGLLSAATTALASLAGYLLAAFPVRILRPTRLTDSSLHVLGLGLMLGACLPVLGRPVVPIAAGLILGLAAHVVGRSHRVRASPIAVALVLAWLIPQYLGAQGLWTGRLGNLQAVQAVLGFDHLALGNLFNTGKPGQPEQPVPWWQCELPRGVDAVKRPQPAKVFIDNQQAILADGSLLAVLMNNQNTAPADGSMSNPKVTDDRLSRVEELLIGCVPGPVGATSKALIILLGFYLIYRRLSWWPMPLLSVGAALATFALLPVEINGHWTLVAQRLLVMGPELAFIFNGYLVLTSPLLLVCMILAPASAPMSVKGKVLYSLVIGASLVIIQWLAATPESGYASLLVAGLLARPLDRLHPSPFVKKA